MHSSKNGPSTNLLAVLALQRDPLVRDRWNSCVPRLLLCNNTFEDLYFQTPNSLLYGYAGMQVCKYTYSSYKNMVHAHLLVHNRESLSNTCRFCSLFSLNLFRLKKTPSVPALALLFREERKIPQC